MRIPSLLYGPYREVRPRCRKAVAKIVEGASWNEAIGHGDLIDTSDEPGLLVLSGPAPALGGEPHFHCYLPLSLLQDASGKADSPDEVEDRAFKASLKSDWGVLGALSPANLMWVYPEARHRPLAHAALEFWDALDKEDARYTVGSTSGQDLWTVNTNLKYVLANLGLDPSVLNAPLPAGGLKALIDGLPKEG